MNKDKEDEREVNPIKLFGMMLPSMPSLTIRLTGMFLRFKRNAHKAGRVFKKDLVKQGVDKKIATELTEIYMQSSHVRNYIQGFNIR